MLNDLCGLNNASGLWGKRPFPLSRHNLYAGVLTDTAYSYFTFPRLKVTIELVLIRISTKFEKSDNDYWITLLSHCFVSSKHIFILENIYNDNKTSLAGSISKKEKKGTGQRLFSKGYLTNKSNDTVWMIQQSWHDKVINKELKRFSNDFS